MSEINILIPGLFWKNTSDINYIYQSLNTPNLNKLLNHASYKILKQQSLSQIFYLLKNNINAISQAELFATQLNITNQYHNFLLCEPTYLRLDRNRLLISEAELLQLAEDEAKQYIELINNHFNNEIKIYYIHEELWLLGHNYSTNKHIRPPIIDIIGENIDDYMDRDNDYGHKLNTIINEIQMLLYNCAYNKLRESDGLLSLNSVWLSDINLSSLTLPKFNVIYTNSLKKIFNDAKPFTIDTLANLLTSDILILDELYYPNCYLDKFGYIDKLNSLDRKIFAKLRNIPNKSINLIVPQSEQTIIIKISKPNILNRWRKTNIMKLTKDIYET